VAAVALKNCADFVIDTRAKHQSHTCRHVHSMAIACTPAYPITHKKKWMGVLSHPFDTLVVAAFALGIYCWGAATGMPAHLVRLEDEDDESEAELPLAGTPSGLRPVSACTQASS
jgi:hypothetical protein